jgi:thioredoxin-like negative regulator of GroEL
MAQTWIDLGIKFKSNRNLIVGEVNCESHRQLCTKYNINGYPSLVLYNNGKKIGDYLGSRDIDSFTSFLNSHLKNKDEL